ncbi:MAG: hypothetical protein R3E93_08605 [Thiothrix sp.]
MNKRFFVMDQRVERSAAQLLLEGLIVYRQDLGELGKQLERLLRQGGVRSVLDPAFSMKFH